VAVKNSASSLFGDFMGDLWGKVMKADVQEFVISIQEYHRDYFRKLVSYQKGSYDELIKAKAEFDEKYGYYALLCADTSDINLLKNSCVLKNISNDVPWEEELKTLVECIEKYQFDMDYINEIYPCILSTKSQKYISELSLYVNSLEQLLADNNMVFEERMDEWEDVYLSRMEEYVSFMKECMNSRSVPMFEHMSSFTVHKVGRRTLYESDDCIKVISESNVLKSPDATIRMYTMKGEPIYIETPSGKAYLKDGDLISYTCSESYAQLLYKEALEVLRDSITKK